MSNKDNYLVIWKNFTQDSPTAQHLSATGSISLPYLVEGKDKEAFQQKQALDLTPLHLIKGLLVGYFDKPPGVDTDFAKQKTKEIIEEHLEAFKANSLEQFILDVANYLRDAHGSKTSLQALMTGIELLPESALMKYDASFDLICCIDDELIEDRMAAVQQLKLLLSKLDPTHLAPQLASDYTKMIKIANEY